MEIQHMSQHELDERHILRWGGNVQVSEEELGSVTGMVWLGMVGDSHLGWVRLVGDSHLGRLG